MVAGTLAKHVGVFMLESVRVRVRDRIKGWDNEAFAQLCRKVQLSLMSRNVEQAQNLVAAFARSMEPEKRPKLSLGDSVALLVDPATAGLLQAAGYETISSLKYAADNELRRIERFGPGRLAMVRQALVDHGFVNPPKNSTPKLFAPPRKGVKVLA